MDRWKVKCLACGTIYHYTISRKSGSTTACVGPCPKCAKIKYKDL